MATKTAEPDFYGGTRHGANLFANCLLALDAATGKRLWHYQMVHHDVLDRDPPSPPVLLTVRRGGRMIDAVAQATKHGLLFVYTTEDRFFHNMLDQEAAHQRLNGVGATPLRDFVSVHRDSASFPPDLRRAMAGGRRGSEFAGEDGRHYHLRALTPGYLVAEVSRELVVRPRMPFIMGFLGVSMLVILALVLGLGYWIAYRATAPLARLTGLVAAAAPNQLPRGLADGLPDDEIGQLARALDAAMARIAGFIEREQHFTRDASHELRTPLAVIDGAAQLLAQQPLPAQAADQLHRIRTAAAQMAHSVDMLLALAREELRADPAGPVALLPLVESVVVQFAHLIGAKPVEVCVDVDPAATVRLHPGALHILLGNLVGNAFAHTQQGQVRIGFADQLLTVADDGPGIAPELAHRLYEAGAKGRGSAGVGLGLSIAQRLAARVGVGLRISATDQGGTCAVLQFGPA